MESREIGPDSAGIVKHLKILKTELRYPHIRVEQDVRRDPATGQEAVISTKQMAADHIVVKLRLGRSHVDLAAVNNRLGAKTLRALRQPGSYLVELPSRNLDAVPDAVAEFKKEGAIIERGVST